MRSLLVAGPVVLGLWVAAAPAPADDSELLRTLIRGVPLTEEELGPGGAPPEDAEERRDASGDAPSAKGGDPGDPSASAVRDFASEPALQAGPAPSAAAAAPPPGLADPSIALPPSPPPLPGFSPAPPGTSLPAMPRMPEMPGMTDMPEMPKMPPVSGTSRP